MSDKPLIIVIILAVVALLLAVAVPNFIRARNTKAANACVNNLRIIQGAKEQWAMEQHKTTNDAPTLQDLQPYMGRGVEGEIPVCPEGGTYTPGRAGEPARCSIGRDGHVLPWP
jgi:competence protein ComGC